MKIRALAAAGIVLAGLVLAADRSSAQTAAPPAQPAGAMVDAEVRRIDKDQGKVTLRHAPIPQLDMPAMTMVFRAAEPAMLDRMQVGQKIRFQPERIDGQYVVRKFEYAN